MIGHCSVCAREVFLVPARAFHGGYSDEKVVANHMAQNGIIAFRTWGNMYVSVSPPRVLTAGEFDRLLEAVRPWDAGRGMLMALDEEATP